MASQVAVAEVAVVPTFKGFRKKTTSEAEGAAQDASSGFSRVFSKSGSDSGKAAGAGFKKAFEGSAQGASDKVTKQLEADVARSTRALSAARLKEQDAAGKVRIAEKQLAEARSKYADDSSQVVRAEERLASASRQLGQAHGVAEQATDDLRKAQGQLAHAADHAGEEMAQAGERGTNGFRSNVLGGIKGFAGPLVAAFAALGIGQIVADAFSEAKDFVLETITIASDLNESVNAVQVAYGDASDAVLKLGDSSAKTFGLSKRELNSYATQFSSFVQTIAGSGGDVAGTLQQLIGRGSDFASVYNLQVSDALQVFQSGLAGESEPLRKFGVDLSAASVEAYALSSGIVQNTVDSQKLELAQNALARATEKYSEQVAKYGEDSTEASAARDAVTKSEMALQDVMGGSAAAMTEAQKVQARYGLLLQQTSKVQGDFANTSDQLANKNRINAASWDDVQAKIGTAFLPVAQQLATILGDDVIPIIAELAEKHGPDLAKAFADVLPSLTDLAQEVLPRLPELLNSVAEALPVIINLISAVTPLLIAMSSGTADGTAALGALFSLISGDTSLDTLVQKLTSLPGPLGDAMRAAFDMASGFGSAMAQAANAVRGGVDSAIGFITSLPGRALSALGDLGSFLFSSGEALMGGFLRGIKSMFGPIGDAVSGALDWLSGFFPHSPALRGPLSGSGWSRLKSSGEAYWEQFVGGMGNTSPVFPDWATAGVGSAALPLGSSGSTAVSKSVYAPISVDARGRDGRIVGKQIGRQIEEALNG